MNGEFEIKTTNLTCGYRVFDRCRNSNNKSIVKRPVFTVQINTSICNKECCPIKIEELNNE